MENGGQFDITLDVLAEVLGLPPGSRIVSVVGDVRQQTFQRTVTVMVSHPDLPEIAEGAIPVHLDPCWEDEAGSVSRLVGWGVSRMWEGDPEANRGGLVGPCALMGD